jgi:acetyl esterase/lipase
MAAIRSFITVSLLIAALVGKVGAQEQRPSKNAKASCNVDVPANVIFQPDLVYGKAGNIPLMLDLALLKNGKGPYPAILIFHGTGPWNRGRAAMREYTLALAQRGFAALAVGFRHESKHAFPAAFDDALTAVDWVQANAKKHGIDKNRIGVLGFSGGGGLAMMLGTKQPKKIKAVVSFYGPSDMVMLHKNADGLAKFFLRPMLEQWLGGPPKEVPCCYRDASPITFVKKGAAPHLFIHGTDDSVVPLEHSTIMARKLKKAGVKVRMLALEGAPHDFEVIPGLYAQVAFQATEFFFAKHLQQRPDPIGMVGNR